MVRHSHRGIDGMGDWLSSHLAIIATEVSGFCKRYGNNIKCIRKDLRFFFIDE